MTIHVVKARNYKDVNLLNKGYNIYTNVLRNRFQTIDETFLLEEQAGFHSGLCVLTMYLRAYNEADRKTTLLPFRNTDSCGGRTMTSAR